MFDTEKFISEVQQRPALYDVQSEEYSNRTLRASSWAEVGEAMYSDWHHVAQADREALGREMTRKWKTVRDNFVREVKLRRRLEAKGAKVKKRKYMFYDRLAFLIPYLSDREGVEVRPVRRARTPPPEEKRQQRGVATPQHETGGDDKFGNRAFLMSYLPLMDSLSPRKSMDVRIQVTEVFRNAVITSTDFLESAETSVLGDQQYDGGIG